MGKVVRVARSRWKTKARDTAATPTRVRPPKQTSSDCPIAAPNGCDGLLAAVQQTDGSLHLTISGAFLDDEVIAMAVAIQLAEFARSLHQKKNNPSC